VNAITSLRWQIARQLGLRFLYAHSALTPHGYAGKSGHVTLMQFIRVPREHAAGRTACGAALPGPPEAGQARRRPCPL